MDQQRDRIQNYQTAWLRQLQKAYDTLLWQKRLTVKSPAALGLMKGHSAWGRWVEGEGRILISEELILNHPWPAVLGILGHEMAHQLVSERPAATRENQPAHGPLFQFMGAKLGLEPFYLKAAVDLREPCPRPWPEADSDSLTDSGAKVLEKVRKLLALSGSPVAAEAQAAMSAAARLMARHNLTLLKEERNAAPAGTRGSPNPAELFASHGGTGGERPRWGYRRIALHAPRIDSRLGLIAHILGRHFFVRALFVPSYDPHTDTEGHDLEVLGRPENTRLAEHVCRFLLERSESLWQDYRKHHPGGGLTARNSFITGLLRGFDHKLEEAAAADAAGPEAGASSAVVLAQDRGLAAYCKKRHPRVHTRRPGRRCFCPESDQAGQAAGRALNLNRPLDDRCPTESRGLYLPESL